MKLNLSSQPNHKLALKIERIQIYAGKMCAHYPFSSVVLNQRRYAIQETFANIWRNVQLSQQGSYCWHLVGLGAKDAAKYDSIHSTALHNKTRLAQKFKITGW